MRKTIKNTTKLSVFWKSHEYFEENHMENYNTLMGIIEIPYIEQNSEDI